MASASQIQLMPPQRESPMQASTKAQTPGASPDPSCWFLQTRGPQPPLGPRSHCSSWGEGMAKGYQGRRNQAWGQNASVPVSSQPVTGE